MAFNCFVTYSRHAPAGPWAGADLPRQEDLALELTAHPSHEALDQLISGTLADPRVQKQVVLHLLRRCAVCTRYLHDALLPELTGLAGALGGAPGGAAAPLGFGTPGGVAAALGFGAPDSDAAGAPLGFATPDGTGAALGFGAPAAAAAAAAGAADTAALAAACTAAAPTGHPSHPTSPAAYDGLFAGSLQRAAAGHAAIHEERLAAAACWVRLRSTAPAAERMHLVTTDERFHRLAVAARLLDEVRADEDPGPNPGHAITPREACDLAVAIADRLPSGRYPQGQVADLRARAWMVEADTLRLYGRPDDARGCLRRAADAQQAGSGDALEQAALHCLEADIDLEQGEIGAAITRLRRALATYRLLGERHEAGRVLQKLSQAIGHEQPVHGVVTAERALALIEPGRDLHLDLAVRHGLIWFLNDGGMSWQALDLLEASRRLYRQLSDTQPYLLLPWLEARICRRLGELGAAERGFDMAWRDLRWSFHHQEAALVSLDLAEVYLARGKTHQAVQLLADVTDNLDRWSMHAEGVAAWSRLVAVVEGAAAGAGAEGEPAAGGGASVPGNAAAVIRDASRYFRRSWRRPAQFAL
jgi:tetratricopeptide (TPR) repeat protein